MKKKLRLHAWGILRYVIFFLIVFFLWWYFRTYELFLALVISLLVPVVSIASLLYCQDSFGARVSLPGTGIGKGKAVPVGIWITNKRKLLAFPANVTYALRNVFTEYEVQKKLRIFAVPGKTKVLEEEITSHHYGRVEAAVTELDLFDWLGIISLNTEVGKCSWVIAQPQGSNAENEELTLSIEDFPNENETKKRGTDINPDYEIREYIPGDELKSIHWKLTAKTGRTMVRERLATGRDRINVLLALTKNADENDALMVSLHSLSLLLLDKSYPVRLCWLGYDGLIQGRYVAEEGELENVCDEILSISGMRDPEQARQAMEAEYPGETYVLVKHGNYKGKYVRQGE